VSLAADRAAIAQALDAVPDIHGYDDWAPQMVPGDAWVRWAGYKNAGPPLTFTATWKIFVITGGDPGSAMQFLDAHLMLILDALSIHAYTTDVRPVEFQTANAGVLYGAEITAEKES
jgi:hypothetical protein